MALKDVKKMCSKFCTGKSSEIVGYTPPTLHKGVRWFVDFTAFDPARDIIALLRKEMEGIDEKLAIRYKMLDDANDFSYCKITILMWGYQTLYIYKLHNMLNFSIFAVI